MSTSTALTSSYPSYSLSQQIMDAEDIPLHSAEVKENDRSKYALATKLRPIIHQMEEKEKEQLRFRKIFPLELKEVAREMKSHKCKAMFKVSLVAVSVFFFLAFSLSAAACFRSFEIVDWRQIFSQERDQATDALTYYPNLGHANDYIINAVELIAFVSIYLFWNVHRKVKSIKIKEIFQNIDMQKLSKNEQNYLYKIEMDKLNACGIFHTLPHKTSEQTLSIEDQDGSKYVLERQLHPLIAKIEKEEKKKLTFRKITPLILKEFGKEIKAEPLIGLFKTSLVAVSLFMYLFSFLGAAACYRSFDLYDWRYVFYPRNTTNTLEVEESVQNFSNLGQGNDYLIGGLGFIILTMVYLIKNSYKEAKAHVIKDTFSAHVKENLSDKQKDFLHAMEKAKLRYL
ncbi:MAG: hypothetical protein BGO14_10365 [Chlamydiales bacterium 38-26]|nr:hypothetical protein [Chlamydiales bacterium]OJV11361.1 MAG: hypothetical protein BGO14_10365 [Chlamydiales bacterium 38-26]